MIENEILEYLTAEEIKQLSSCNLCPRRCGVNRAEGKKGFCNTGLSLSVALIINHKGEEPILSKNKGITNVFFSHCNCQCIFCQNHVISCNKTEPKSLYPTMQSVVDTIIQTLETSENVLGFVSPTHQIHVMKAIIRQLHKRNVFPKIVYNSGGYENTETLQSLENIIDVYLPDMKYSDDVLSKQFSSAENYTEIAVQTLKEMYRQKGSSIITDENENILSGLIIRHLILPGYLENSKKVLDTIAWELSHNVTLSLMSQYNPPFKTKYPGLNRHLTIQEYEEIIDFACSLGFHKIYTQELSSAQNVIPDFENNTFINNR